LVVECVSILTGPEEPVQRAWDYAHDHLRKFQSSPAPKSRCNLVYTGGIPAGVIVEFQSSPAPKSRCNVVEMCEIVGAWRVSILTGPEEPVQPHESDRPSGTGGLVSILTGPEEPVQRR